MVDLGKLNIQLTLLTVTEITDKEYKVFSYSNETVASAFPTLCRKGGIAKVPCKYKGVRYFVSVSFNRRLHDSIIDAILYNVTAVDFVRAIEDCLDHEWNGEITKTDEY